MKKANSLKKTLQRNLVEFTRLLHMLHEDSL